LHKVLSDDDRIDCSPFFTRPVPAGVALAPPAAILHRARRSTVPLLHGDRNRTAARRLVLPVALVHGQIIPRAAARFHVREGQRKIDNRKKEAREAKN
jgi:hypothetical protein